MSDDRGYTESMARPNNIKTPLLDRVAKMDKGLGKEFLTSGAYLGDAAINAADKAADAIKKKFK